jgi:arylsulfatase A-like enzyme
MASVLAAPPRDQPNIVFILGDDLGYADLSFMGSRYYETPNIDRLAREGMQFTNFHQAANCAPSRACMMTGQYPPRTGIYTVGTLERGAADRRKMDVPQNVRNLPLDRQTIGDVLTAAGYRTAYFGKWDLGEGEFHPARRGFEEAVVVHGPHFGFRSDPPLPVEAGQIDGDWLTDRAEEFIERPRAGPFFVFLAHKLPHAPQQAKPELEAKYRRKPAVGGHNHSTYAAMIESLDQSVGRILAKVHALGLTRKTVVFFASVGAAMPIRKSPSHAASGASSEEN